MALFCIKRLLNSFEMDGRTDQRMGGPTEKWLIESRNTRPKIYEFIHTRVGKKKKYNDASIVTFNMRFGR